MKCFRMGSTGILFLALLIILFNSCHTSSKEEKEIIDNVGKEVNLEMVKVIQNNDVSLAQFRSKYKFLYLVYLKNGCTPCYSTFIDWQREMPTISEFDNFSILFIINSKSYDEFINNAKKLGLKENLYFSFLDSTDSYINGNIDISQNILKKPLLLNEKNQIIMIGSPFSTPEMTSLFKTICSDKKY